MKEKKPKGYWQRMKPTIQRLLKEHGRLETQKKLNLRGSDFLKICKRYDIEVERSEVGKPLIVRPPEKPFTEGSDEYNEWIAKRNQIMLMPGRLGEALCRI